MAKRLAQVEVQEGAFPSLAAEGAERRASVRSLHGGEQIFGASRPENQLKVEAFDAAGYLLFEDGEGEKDVFLRIPLRGSQAPLRSELASKPPSNPLDAHRPLPSPLTESSLQRKLASESSSSSSSSSSPSLGNRVMSFFSGHGAGATAGSEPQAQKGDSVSPSSAEKGEGDAKQRERGENGAEAPKTDGVASQPKAPPEEETKADGLAVSRADSEPVSASGARGEASGAQSVSEKTETETTLQPKEHTTHPEAPSDGSPAPATAAEEKPPAGSSGPDAPPQDAGESSPKGEEHPSEKEKREKAQDESASPVLLLGPASPSAVLVPAVFQQKSGDGNHVTLTIPLEVLPSLAPSSEAAASENSVVSSGAELASQAPPVAEAKTEDQAFATLHWIHTALPGDAVTRDAEAEEAYLIGHVASEKRRRGMPLSPDHEEPPDAALPASLEELSSNEREMVLSAGLLTLLLVLSVSLVISHVSRKCQLRWLQMPVSATLLGLLVGAILKFGLQVQGPILGSVLAMNEDVFFVMLLPPIIFEGGLSLSEGSLSVPFMRNFGAIMWLACFCTILSFCWVGAVMFFGGVLGLSMFLTVRQAFAFGALISSTDPVSVLALFKELHAKKTIHVLVFGESLLNDAISIVLYRTIASEDTASVGSAVLAFFLTFFVSLAIGLAVGLFCALTYKYMDLHKEENQTLESALLLLFPWMAYLVADGLGYSGIVAICFCGVTIGKYAVPNLSTSACNTSRSVFNSFSLLAETVVFVFLGLAVFSFDQPLHDELAVGLYVLGFIATFSARAISVYVTCALINLFRTSAKITPEQQLALVLCGLRGAIAFALSERARRDFGGKEGAALLSLTLFLALFTILVLGPSLVFILDRLGIFEKHAPHRSESSLEDARLGPLDSDMEPARSASRRSTADFSSFSEFSSATLRGRERGERRDRHEDANSLEGMTRGTCGGLKRLLLQIDRRQEPDEAPKQKGESGKNRTFMIPLFTHSDSRRVSSRFGSNSRFPSFFRDLRPAHSSASPASAAPASSVFSSFPGLSKSKHSPGSLSSSPTHNGRSLFTSPAYMRVPTYVVASNGSLASGHGGEQKREGGLSWDDLRRSLGVATAPDSARRSQRSEAREVGMVARDGKKTPVSGRDRNGDREEETDARAETRRSRSVGEREVASWGPDSSRREKEREEMVGFGVSVVDTARSREERPDARNGVSNARAARGKKSRGDDPFSEDDFEPIGGALFDAPRISLLQSASCDSEKQEFHFEDTNWQRQGHPFSAPVSIGSLPVVVGRGDSPGDGRLGEGGRLLEGRGSSAEKASLELSRMANGWVTNGQNGAEDVTLKGSIVGKRDML
ncbi:hypothetical protein NCLIV_001080 [Neospora caninum Liverpool]|uniref:Sodium/hydrogen exchanger n=1 Tax=Neospora caninum (strain Liverpool) TaxID=572307 RepID=F0V7C3_NEOCL|nr:hypothetical protein NCLIV_001080 [Neospora caninum Liverpool]CBZ49614.1 hypothetical protein NCLIV_001080 [Neospora caninum Liverpool]|eukprot:XP_003879649.1 hypothetical protein NCLIV_001080 [Neospora caninum Liverpool]